MDKRNKISMKSDVDILRQLVGARLPRKTCVTVFQTRIWLENIFRLTRMNSAEFQEWHAGDNESSNIVLKWLKGKTCVTQTTVNRIETRLNIHSDDIFNLPLYRLLENKPLTLTEIKKLIKPYDTQETMRVAWRFPNDEDLYSKRLARPILHRDDSNSLAERGDLYGFIAILALVRESEAINDCESHLFHMSNLFRALPGACRKQPFYRRWKELLGLIITIQTRKMTTYGLIKPDKGILESQIKAKQHIMLREMCPRDPITGRFILPEDPVIRAKF